MGNGMKNLDVLIGRAASSLTKRRGDQASALDVIEDAFDGLLFMGNPHETVPRGLLLDQRLGAVDVLGWQMIRLRSNADRTTAFPTYDELEPLLRSGANRKASRKTVARVIAILRLTRWMTLGMKARNTKNGRMIGNIYILHDEPLAAAESLSLDADYMAYVVKCTRHHNTSVAEVANLIYDELASSGVPDVPSRLDVIDQRAKRQQRTEFPAETESTTKETQEESCDFQRKLSQFPEQDALNFQRKLRRKLERYDSVSDYGAPTTVRSYTHTVCKTTAREADATALIWSWPLELTADERKSVTFLLTGLTTDVQQAVIDEAAGRLEAGKVKNTMGYLHTLAKRAASNTFQLTHFGRAIAGKRCNYTDINSAAMDKPLTPRMSIPRLGSITPLPSDIPSQQPISRATEHARMQMFKRLGIRR